MKATELRISGAWVFEPAVFPDQRGRSTTPFQARAFREAVGHDLVVGQTDLSVSRRGVVRGVHFSDTPPGQARYVYCARGALLEIVVDVRVGSPTFGEHEQLLLDADDHRTVYLAEGLGHAFIALEDDTVAGYLRSAGYDPAAERGVSPIDPALGLSWPAELKPTLSLQDEDAPTLAEARDQGLLPTWAACSALYRNRRAG